MLRSLKGLRNYETLLKLSSCCFIQNRLVKFSRFTKMVFVCKGNFNQSLAGQKPKVALRPSSSFETFVCMLLSAVYAIFLFSHKYCKPSQQVTYSTNGHRQVSSQRILFKKEKSCQIKSWKNTGHNHQIWRLLDTNFQRTVGRIIPLPQIKIHT